jgi:hypothetical protein
MGNDATRGTIGRADRRLGERSSFWTVARPPHGQWRQGRASAQVSLVNDAPRPSATCPRRVIHYHHHLRGYTTAAVHSRSVAGNIAGQGNTAAQGSRAAAGNMLAGDHSWAVEQNRERGRLHSTNHHLATPSHRTNPDRAIARVRCAQATGRCRVLSPPKCRQNSNAPSCCLRPLQNAEVGQPHGSVKLGRQFWSAHVIEHPLDLRQQYPTG